MPNQPQLEMTAAWWIWIANVALIIVIIAPQIQAHSHNSHTICGLRPGLLLLLVRAKKEEGLVLTVTTLLYQALFIYYMYD